MHWRKYESPNAQHISSKHCNLTLRFVRNFGLVLASSSVKGSPPV